MSSAGSSVLQVGHFAQESRGGFLTHEDFVLGQSKMSVYVRRKKVKDGLD